MAVMNVTNEGAAFNNLYNDLMATKMDFDELKLNIDNMFLVINGIIVSCKYII